MQFKRVKSSVNMAGRVHLQAPDGAPLCGAEVAEVMVVPSQEVTCHLCQRTGACVDAYLRDLEGRVTKLVAELDRYKASDMDATLKADAERLGRERNLLAHVCDQLRDERDGLRDRLVQAEAKLQAVAPRRGCHHCGGRGTITGPGMYYDSVNTYNCRDCNGTGYA